MREEKENIILLEKQGGNNMKKKKIKITPNIIFISIAVLFLILMGILSFIQIKENKEKLLETKYLFLNKIITPKGKVNIYCHITLKFKRKYNSNILTKVCKEAQSQRFNIENDIIDYMSAQKNIFYQTRKSVTKRKIQIFAEHIIKKYISTPDAIESIKITKYSVESQY